MWILALLAAFLGLTRRGYGAAWRDELTILAPAVVVLALVSSQTGFNHHSRYVLPIFPFFFVWMSKAARAFERKERWTAVLVGGAVGLGRGEQPVGLPAQPVVLQRTGRRPCRTDTTTCWTATSTGARTSLLRDWLKDHPEARPLHLAYFGYFDPRAAGIEFALPPKSPTNREEASRSDARELGPHPGWYAVSVAMLRGCEFGIPDGKGGFPWMPLNSFSYFQRFRPVGHRGLVDLYLPHYAGRMSSKRDRRWDCPCYRCQPTRPARRTDGGTLSDARRRPHRGREAFTVLAFFRFSR